MCIIVNEAQLLTCNSNSSNSSLVWFVNGTVVGEGSEVMEDGRRTVSHWLFVAPEGYTEVECRDSEKRVATVPFYVSGTVTEVALTFEPFQDVFL